MRWVRCERRGAADLGHNPDGERQLALGADTGLRGYDLNTFDGTSWAARVGRSTEGWRGDVGAGLLVELTRASNVKIVRFEVAFPDRGGKPVYLVTTDLFKAPHRVPAGLHHFAHEAVGLDVPRRPLQAPAHVKAPLGLRLRRLLKTAGVRRPAAVPRVTRAYAENAGEREARRRPEEL